MNFAGGGVYTYFKYIDSQHQPGPANMTSKDRTSRYTKSAANGHCVQQTADCPNGTANMV